MLDSAQKLIQSAAKVLELTAADTDYLLTPMHEHSFTISLSNGVAYDAFRVQHNNVLGPFKGGVRFHPEVDIEEVRALATLMSLKTAAVGLPLGGGKGGVRVNPKELSAELLEELSRSYARHLADVIGPDADIPAPDVNTNAQIIDWMVDEYEKATGDTSHASFTGKSIKNGGSEGRVDATGRGGAIALYELLKKQGKQDEALTYSVQGFGNVGQYFAISLQQFLPEAKLVAVSDSSATLRCESGLSPAELAEFKQSGGSFKHFDQKGTEVLAVEDIISQPVDVLALAALGDVVTEQNIGSLQAGYVLELANGPVNDAAHDQLTAAGVVVLPDILANAGGVIVSYFEWLQNKRGEHWELDRVHEELENRMKTAMDSAFAAASEHSISLKQAAAVLALQRILEARVKEE